MSIEVTLLHHLQTRQLNFLSKQQTASQSAGILTESNLTHYYDIKMVPKAPPSPDWTHSRSVIEVHKNSMQMKKGPAFAASC
jgi:hypothetical protein